MMMMMNRSSRSRRRSRSSSRRSRSKQVSRVVGQTPERSAADCGARPAGCKICLQNPVIKVAAAGAREPGLTKFRQKANLNFFKNSKRKRKRIDFGGFQSPQLRTKKRKKNYKKENGQIRLFWFSLCSQKYTWMIKDFYFVSVL